MNTKNYHIPSIHCMHCVNTIRTELIDLEGVKEVNVDIDSKQVDVMFEPPATEEIIVKTLQEIGYSPEE